MTSRIELKNSGDTPRTPPLGPKAPNPFIELSPLTTVAQLIKDSSPSGYVPLPREASGVSRRLADGFASVQKAALQSAKPPKDMVSVEDAEAAKRVFEDLCKGQSPVQVRGSKEFRARVFRIFAKLMMRPSGRLLIHSLHQSKEKIVLIPGKESSCQLIDSRIVVTLALDSREYLVCRDGQRNLFLVESIPFVETAHELIHALHKLWWNSLKDPERLKAAVNHFTSHGTARFPDLEEQFTIAGIPGSGLLSENMIRCEFDLPERVTHISSHFPPYKPEFADKIHEPNEEGINWIQNAAYLGLASEVEKLLKAGGNLQDAWFAAVEGGQLRILDMLVKKYEMDLDALNSDGMAAVHIAAQNDNVKVLKYLNSLGANLNLKDAQKKTALHYAAVELSVDAAKYLLKEGAVLKKKTVDAFVDLIGKPGIDSQSWDAMGKLFNANLSKSPAPSAKRKPEDSALKEPT